MEEYLREKKFYEMSGLPWRRGYLFYGVPGGGKSSLIAALAHELQLDIYLINLGAKGLDDDRLQGLLQACPGNCILLMEDIDCAFKKRKSKRRSRRRQSLSSSSSSSSSNSSLESESGSDTSTSSKSSCKKDKKDEKGRDDKDKKDKKKSNTNNHPQQGFGSNLSLSGLFNALDGVASSEGRSLFCTTNWVDKIDEALSRPVTSEKDTKFDLDTLAEELSQAIPEGKVSVSALQGYLMRFKREPTKAIESVADWLENGCGKGPTMTLTKKGMEMRKLDSGKDGLDTVKERQVKKAKEDKKDGKDKQDKKGKKGKKETKDNEDKGIAQDTKDDDAKGGDSDRSETLKVENDKGGDGSKEGNGLNDDREE
ncbi:hypothetical protein I203_105052 [Kwoniella mangroviensis CBS 8507]|uniref:uncharacterized protein n=1 Tax=Kwoniella mangroviensis CBS 8507 TaxID=1296122 RepID=UPI00304CC9A8